MRKYYLDNIRWGTVVLVVFYHVIYMYNGVAAAGVIGPFHEIQYQDAVQYLLYPWFMLLLFLISGMCARYYLETHTLQDFVRSRTRKLLVPCTAGLLTVGWIQGYINMSISDAFRSMPDTLSGIALYFILVLSGTGVLWFIQMLWLFSMLLAFALRLLRAAGRWKTAHIHRPEPAIPALTTPSLPVSPLRDKTRFTALLLLVIPVYLSGLLLNTPVIAVYRFGIYGFGFFLGYLVLAREEIIDCISRHRLPLLFTAVLLAAAYLFLHFGDNYAVAPTVNCISATAYGWAACLAIIGCMKKWGDAMPRFAAFMTKRSYGLYILHYLPLSATACALDRFTRLPALPCYLLTAFAAFAGSLILYETILRIPVLRWCVLGYTRTDVTGRQRKEKHNDTKMTQKIKESQRR